MTTVSATEPRGVCGNGTSQACYKANEAGRNCLKKSENSSKNLPVPIWEQDGAVPNPTVQTTFRRKPPKTGGFLRFLVLFFSLDDCCSTVIQGAEKR